MGAGAAKKVAVLGLGNPVLGDDAVGLRVAEALGALLASHPLPGVEVLSGTRGGFEFLDLLAGFHAAVVVDSIEVPEPVPGRIRRLDPGALAGSARMCGAHEVSLPVALAFGRLMEIPLPEVVEIYAVEVADARTVTESMDPRVESAVEPLAREVAARLPDLISGAA